MISDIIIEEARTLARMDCLIPAVKLLRKHDPSLHLKDARDIALGSSYTRKIPDMRTETYEVSRDDLASTLLDIRLGGGEILTCLLITHYASADTFLVIAMFGPKR